MEQDKLVLGVVIAFIIDILLNMFWPVTILANVILQTVVDLSVELTPQYAWMFFLITAILAISEYLLILGGVLAFLKNPSEWLRGRA